MKVFLATIVILVAMLVSSGVAYVLTDPSVFIAGTAVMVLLFQHMPWGLFSASQPPDDDGYQGTNMGFIQDDEELDEYVEFDEDDETERNKSKKK